MNKQNLLFFLKTHHSLILGFEEGTNKKITIGNYNDSLDNGSPIELKGYDLSEAKELYKEYISHISSCPIRSFDLHGNEEEQISKVWNFLLFMKNFVKLYYFYKYDLTV